MIEIRKYVDKVLNLGRKEQVDTGLGSQKLKKDEIKSEARERLLVLVKPTMVLAEIFRNSGTSTLELLPSPTERYYKIILVHRSNTAVKFILYDRNKEQAQPGLPGNMEIYVNFLDPKISFYTDSACVGEVLMDQIGNIVDVKYQKGVDKKQLLAFEVAHAMIAATYDNYKKNLNDSLPQGWVRSRYFDQTKEKPKENYQPSPTT